MDGGFFSYRPPRNSPLVGPLPAKEKGYLTFGSFNNSLKINPLVMELWARVLNANEDSRFVMKFQGASDEGMRNFYLGEFERFGVDRSRIDTYEVLSSHFEHLQLYNQVDLILDTYPFNGCITSLESLWMGVPVVTFTGERFCSRHSSSHLINAGLSELVAPDVTGYIDIACELASDLERLENYRASLREQCASSPLCPHNEKVLRD